MKRDDREFCLWHAGSVGEDTPHGPAGPSCHLVPIPPPWAQEAEASGYSHLRREYVTRTGHHLIVGIEPIIDIALSPEVIAHFEERAALFAKEFDRLPGFTCPRCQATSHHPEDLAQGYCGRCHWWTGNQGLPHPNGPLP